MRNIIFTCTTLVLLALAPIPQEVPTLVVGSIAPPIDSLELVQGELVSNPKVRVVEFWATRFAACKKSIPHINELYQSQQQNGLEVIGVSDETREKVEPFVRMQGSQMSYTVALDSGKKVSSAYMQAAGKEIPCAFVIGQNNKIVYIGLPMDPEFTNAVKRSLIGRFDPKLSKQAAPKLDAAHNAIKAKNFKDGYKRFDEVIELDPMIFSEISLEKYRVMLNDEKNTVGAKNYAKEMFAAFVAAGDTFALRDLALTLSSDPRVSIYDNDLALAAAEAMLKSSSSSDPSANATLASVHYARGDFAKAVEAQKKAMRVASPIAKSSYKPTLDAYELAVKRGVKVAVPVAAVPQPATATPTTVPATVPVGTP